MDGISIGMPVSCCMLKRCPISCAMVLETAGSEPKSSTKPTDKAVHIVSTYANPTILLLRLVPLEERWGGGGRKGNKKNKFCCFL